MLSSVSECLRYVSCFVVVALLISLSSLELVQRFCCIPIFARNLTEQGTILAWATQAVHSEHECNNRKM